MNIKSLFKNALNGQISDNSLKIKESSILNIVLALITSLSLVISLKLFGKNISDTLSLAFPEYFSYASYLGLDTYITSIINKLIFNIFLIAMLTQLCILYILPGIMFIISKYILNLNIRYGLCLSANSTANIIPTFITALGILLSLLFPLLGYTILVVNVLVILIYTYDAFSTLIRGRKSKVMISSLISYLLSSFISSYISYSVLYSAIESKLNSLF